MTAQIRKAGGGATGYSTWNVFASGTRVGQVRAAIMPNPADQVWAWNGYPDSNGWVGTFDKRRDAANAMLEAGGYDERVEAYARPNRGKGKGSPPDHNDGTPTDVVCACGHTYRFNIRRPSAIAWLKTKPCPSCNRAEKEGRTPPKAQDGSPMPEPNEVPVPDSEPEPEPDHSEAIAALLASWPQVVNEVQHVALVDLTLLLSRSLAVWMQGPPGTGKSTLAEQAARALGLTFHPISCHEMMTRTDLFGYRDANGIDHETPLWTAYRDGGLVLLDEVDNGNPNLLAALNSAMSNGHCVFGSGTVVPRHADFRIVATANTAGLGPEAGYIGRNGVDLATRDRFVTLPVPIDANVERALAAYGLGDADAVQAATDTAVENAERLRRSRATVAAGNRVAADDVVKTVERVRIAVDERFRGSVVSPRTSQHVAAMLTVGFTVREAIAAKLVGFKPDEAASVIPDDGVSA